MKFFQANMQTGILVLLVVLVAIVCVALFFTNKEVRNIKAGVVKSRHDIAALQNLLSEAGLAASGGRLGNPEDDEMVDPRSREGPPRSQFMGPPGMPPGMAMFPPGMFPPGVDPSQLGPIPEQDEKSNGSGSPSSLNDTNPEPLPANTEAEPAALNLEKPDDPVIQEVNGPTGSTGDNVIPIEDVEEVKAETKTETKTPPKSTSAKANQPASKPAKKAQKTQKVEESSDEDSDSDEESDSSDED